MTSGKPMKRQDPGVSTIRSAPDLVSRLRHVNRRKACVGVGPLVLSVFKEERPDHIVVDVDFSPGAIPELSLVSSVEVMEFTEQRAIHKPVRHWRGIIVGCAVFLLLAGTMAVQFRASMVTVLGSEPRTRGSVEIRSNTPSSPPPNSMLPLQDGAEALSSSILVPANPSSSAIPTKMQPQKDTSRLLGSPQIPQQPTTLAIAFAQSFRDRAVQLATAYLWLAEQNGRNRTSIASVASDPAPSGKRAILYEEDVEDAQEKRFHGRVDWRTEWSPRPGREPELAIIGEITIPERKVRIIWSLRRTSEELPASHAIEIKFEVPPEYSLGQIVNVPGVLARQPEQSVGDRLKGTPVKLSNGFFRIDLSPLDTENARLLKERPSFEIPFAYSSGRRGLLTIEKGALGDQAFSSFFRAAASSFDSESN
jgi:hypothetical protein